ncbi:MAG TPA: nucleotide disphospho-sugar-binding domain-containing protein [Propionibacteriaceae bacterium]|nr:nucleotide disphospho-sugar-binding domain-containing protein [Propionibacteriaceae bacterium]
MRNSATTYLVALVDGGGTVPPELGAIRRLVERGHGVTALAEESMEPEVRATGATFRPWVTAPNRPDRRPENDPYRDWEVKNPLQLLSRLIDKQFVGPAARYLADLNAAIAEHRPDAVLCSQFAFGAMVGAEAAGIPFAVLMPNVYLVPAKGLPPFGFGFRPARGPAGRLRDRLVSGFSERLWNRKGLPGLNALRVEVGLDPLASFWDQVHRADRELVMTSPAFDFPATLPAKVGYVGPVLDDPTWAGSWTPPPGDDPLVLVALSSTFQDQVDELRRIALALGELPVRGLITTGPALEASALEAPPNVVVLPSAPHTRVLQHAAAVITHGGHGTVIKALAAGVPMVVMPCGRDQPDNAVRVTARGAGLMLKRTAKPAVIAAAVERLLHDPSYREAAQQLGQTVRRDADSGALVDELEDLVGADSRR